MSLFNILCDNFSWGTTKSGPTLLLGAPVDKGPLAVHHVVPVGVGVNVREGELAGMKEKKLLLGDTFGEDWGEIQG